VPGGVPSHGLVLALPRPRREGVRSCLPPCFEGLGYGPMARHGRVQVGLVPPIINQYFLQSVDDR